MSFTIVVGPGAAATRDCHLEADGTAFPADPWRDRPLVIVGWWAENHVEMRRTGNRVRNSFMEGPYEFTVTPEGATLTLELIARRRDADETLGRHTVAVQDYESALLGAAQSVLDTASAVAGNHDLDTLRANVSALRTP